MKYPETLAPRLLQGRLALISGAGQGNGSALALGLTQVGARQRNGHEREHCERHSKLGQGGG